MIIKLLQGQFVQNNLEKKNLLGRCFSIINFWTLNLQVFKVLVKILWAEIFEAIN